MDLASDVWDYGVLPLVGSQLSEERLLSIISLPTLPSDLAISLELWASLISYVRIERFF